MPVRLNDPTTATHVTACDLPGLDLVDVHALRRILGVCRTSVHEWTHRAHDPLPSYRLAGKCLRFSLSEVRCWLRRQRVRAPRAAGGGR